MAKHKHTRGFSMVESVLAAAIFVIFATAALAVTLFALTLNQTGEEQTIAESFAIEGIEALRSIRNSNYTSLVNSVATGIAKSGGVWAFSGANNTFEKYTRVIKVEDVYRDVGGNIVANGGVLDSNTKKITSTVSWNLSAGRTGSSELTDYLTNFRKSIIGNWSLPTLASTLNLPGGGNGYKLKVQGVYAYVVRDSGNPDFIIVDVSNTLVPTIVGSIALNGTPSNIDVSGNYAYVSSSENASELQIINVINPAAPALVGVYNAAGNANANSVIIAGNMAYLARANSGDPELIQIDVTVPAAPILVSSLNLLGNIYDLKLMGNYLYTASSDNNQELQIVDVTNPLVPVAAGNINILGNNDKYVIDAFDSTVVIGGVGGDFSTINVSNPLIPTLISTLNVGGTINDISLANNNTYAFLATSNNASDFQVLDISNTAAMATLSTINMANSQYGVYYDSVTDRVFSVGNDGNNEFSIIIPG